MLRRCSQALTTIRNRSQPFATVRRFPYRSLWDLQRGAALYTCRVACFFCQGCIKWWQRANHAAGVGHRESVIFPWQRQYLVQIRCVSLCVECHFPWQAQYFGHSPLYTLRSTLYTWHPTVHTLHLPLPLYTLLSTLYTLNFTLNTLHSVLHTLHLSV